MAQLELRFSGGGDLMSGGLPGLRLPRVLVHPIMALTISHPMTTCLIDMTTDEEVYRLARGGGPN
jgi:hypothetical protein